jgi:hypothetical protein
MPRPKTGKAYEVLNCRVPPGIIARINAHAELHSQRVRDVVAEALLAYLDGTQVAPLETGAAQVVRQAQQRLSEAVKLLGTVQAPRRAPAGPPAASVTTQPDGTPAYDTTKFYLGKLCPRGHDWHGTGKTLRRKPKGRCDFCHNEDRKEGRAAKRAQAA